jgi:hypothetical protein
MQASRASGADHDQSVVPDLNQLLGHLMKTLFGAEHARSGAPNGPALRGRVGDSGSNQKERTHVPVSDGANLTKRAGRVV